MTLRLLIGLLALAGGLLAQPSPAVRVYVWNEASGELGRLAPGSRFRLGLSTTSGGWPGGPDGSFRLVLRPAAGPEIPIPVDSQSSKPCGRMPTTVPLGKADLVVTWNNQPPVSTPVEITASSFGLYSRIADVADAWILPPDEDSVPRPARLRDPILPGNRVRVLGTGLGNSTPSDIEAFLGNIPVDVVSATANRDDPGRDQVELSIPVRPLLSQSCYSPLSLRIRGRETNVVTLPISLTPGGCQHPLALTPRQMEALDRGQVIALFESSLTDSVAPMFSGNTFEHVPGRIRRFETAELRVNWRNAEMVSWASSAAAKPRGCFVRPEGATSIRGSVLLLPTMTPPADLGETLKLTTPTTDLLLERPLEPGPTPSFYRLTNGPPEVTAPSPDALPPVLWKPGRWTIDGANPNQPLHLEATVPEALRLTNFADARTIDRARDLTLRWNGSGYSEAHTVSVNLIGRIECTVPASAGFVTIPASLLSQIPAATSTPESTPILSLNLNLPPVITSVPTGPDADPIPAIWSFYSSLILPVDLR